MNRYQLGVFQFWRNPNSGDLRLLANGPTHYRAVLVRAFPGLYFSPPFADRFGLYTWGTYIRGADAAHESALQDFCGTLQHAVLIEDDLTESYALSFHTQASAAGAQGYERTAIGQLVREAKPYNLSGSLGSREKAIELANLFSAFIRRHPTYQRAALIVAVPPSNLTKSFDLPTVLAETIATASGKPNATGAIRKIRATRPMKDCRSVADKITNLKDAFSADSASFQEKSVILVDDIYETGFTLNEVARSVRTAGATMVLGLVATKTARDLPAEPAPGEEDDDFVF